MGIPTGGSPRRPGSRRGRALRARAGRDPLPVRTGSPSPAARAGYRLLDLGVRAELEGKLPRLRRTGQHVHACALRERDLRRDVRRRAEHVDAEPAARRQRRQPQRPISDDPCAQQGGRVFVVVRGRQPVSVGLVNDRTFGVSPVRVPSGEPRRDAQVLLPSTAPAAAAAGMAQPGNPYPLADCEAGCA